MSDGGLFFVVLMGVILLGLFVIWLWVKYHAETEAYRERQALAEFGPLFQTEPMKPYVTQSRGAHLRYKTPDWEAMEREAGR